MNLKHPFFISSRLMAGLKVGSNDTAGEINLEYSKRRGSEQRTRYHYVISVGKNEYEANDLQSGNHGGADIKYGFVALLDYLVAAGESYHYNGNKMEKDSNTDLFPEWVCEWAYINSDELSMLACEIEENRKDETADKLIAE